MKYYEVVRIYYTLGGAQFVHANTFTHISDNQPISTTKQGRRGYICKDYFADPVEAEDFRQTALNA